MLILVSNLFLSPAFSGGVPTWELPAGAIARLGKGGVRKIQYSPDNRFLAVASDLGVWLYDIATFQEAAFFTGDTDGISTMSLSPDGRIFAVGIGGGAIQLWDTIVGERKMTLLGHTNGIFCLTFSPDGKTLASGSSDNTIRLWDTETGIHKETLKGHTAWVCSLAFSSEGQILLSGGDDMKLQCLSLIHI